MSFFEDDEEQTEVKEITQRRPPRGRKPGGPSPLARMIAILLAVVVLVVITSIGIKSCLGNKRVDEYRGYFTAVEAVTKDSDEVGRQLSEMFQKPDESVRQSLESRLAEFQATSDALVERARQIEAPDQFKQENEWFIASMQVRALGLRTLQPAMLNALEARDNQAGAAQVSHEMLILLSSDVAYEEFFKKPAEQVLKDEKITDVKVPQSKFIKDPALASQQTAVSVIERLKGGADVQVTGLHGVEIVSVKVKPSGMDLTTDSQNSLKASDSLTFEVEVENGGEATETDVPVSVSLTAPGRSSPQKVDGRIPSIAPGERKTIELTGLAAETGDQPALLRVEAGPVPGETKTDNNIREFNIIFS